MQNNRDEQQSRDAVNKESSTKNETVNSPAADVVDYGRSEQNQVKKSEQENKQTPGSNVKDDKGS